jgi:hypothetical protein
MKGLGLPPIRVVDEDNPDEWIEIKAKLTVHDQQVYKDELMKLTLDGSMDLTTVDWETPLLELAIVGWNLTTEDGKPWPYSKARVGELPHDLPLIEAVSEAIAKANPFFGYRTRPREATGSENSVGSTN